MPCHKRGGTRRLIHHEEQRYTVGQAKKHLRHHRGTKMLKKQIKAGQERRHERREKNKG